MDVRDDSSPPFFTSSTKLTYVKAAKMVCGPREPIIDCTIVECSPGGACLEVFGLTVLPNRFELFWAGRHKEKVPCGPEYRKANRCCILRDRQNG
jgi:hypothetical protein